MLQNARKCIFTFHKIWSTWKHTFPVECTNFYYFFIHTWKRCWKVLQFFVSHLKNQLLLVFVIKFLWDATYNRMQYMNHLIKVKHNSSLITFLMINCPILQSTLTFFHFRCITLFGQKCRLKRLCCNCINVPKMQSNK